MQGHSNLQSTSTRPYISHLYPNLMQHVLLLINGIKFVKQKLITILVRWFIYINQASTACTLQYSVVENDLYLFFPLKNDTSQGRCY